MKLKKILAALLACACMTACDAPASGEEPEKTQEPSADTVNIARYYSDLDKENHFEAIPKEKVTSILAHGTAVLVFSFPECPWCQAYIPLLEEALAEQDVQCSYYNIYVDKEGDREFYDSAADLMISQNDTGEEIIHYDNDGRKVIYMPLVLFIEKGRITDGLVPRDSAIFGKYRGDCVDGSISHTEIVDFMVRDKKRDKIFAFYSALCEELANAGL